MEQKQAEAVDTAEELQNDEALDNEALQAEELQQDEVSSEEQAEQQAHTEQIEVVEKSAFDALQEKADEYQQRFLRAQADFENFRRRTRLEKEEAAKYRASDLIEQLLPVLDNFERAMASSQETKDFDALLKGIEIVYRQILQALEQEGLKHIEAEGEPFNPEFHEAVVQVDSEEHGEGIVVEEIQKGYILKDKVLRASMVKVSK